MYREKRIYSGPILEVEIYPITKAEKNMSRKKKEKQSKLSQKNLNDKNAKKHLIRLINTNFTDNDLAVHLTYDNDNLPENEEMARRDVTNYLRRLKHYRKKNGLPALKYIAVVEYKEAEDKKKGVRIHHHIIINSIDRDIAEQIWLKGRANADRLKADVYGYEGLARYMSKDPKGLKRWIQSKGLKMPIVKVNDCKYTKRKAENISKLNDDREFEKLYPGYIFTECRSDVNDISAGVYLYIKMRQSNLNKKPKKTFS